MSYVCQGGTLFSSFPTETQLFPSRLVKHQSNGRINLLLSDSEMSFMKSKRQDRNKKGGIYLLFYGGKPRVKYKVHGNGVTEKE